MGEAMGAASAPPACRSDFSRHEPGSARLSD
jgi:hypothetical protein